jgi:hypothetical protein
VFKLFNKCEGFWLRVASCDPSRSFPGLLTALDVAGAHPLMEGVKSLCARGEHQKAHAAVFEVLDAGRENVLTKDLDPGAIKKIARNWKLRECKCRRALPWLRGVLLR